MTRRREQVARIQGELEEARRRAHGIAVAAENDAWRTRPGPDQWSVAECVVHLNTTSRAFLPLIKAATDRDRPRPDQPETRYRMDFVGWLLWWAAIIRLPIKTTEPFVPTPGEPKDVVLSEFDALQDELIGWLRNAEGFDLGKLRIVSPFDSRIKYNLYTCLRLLPAHQRQHLRQAGAVVRTLRKRGAAGA
jgi:DinB superfamily